MKVMGRRGVREWRLTLHVLQCIGYVTVMFELRIYADIVGLQYCKLIMQHQFAVNCIVYCKLAFCLSL